VNQPVGPSVCPSVRPSDRESASEPANQSVSQAVSPVNQSVNQSVRHVRQIGVNLFVFSCLPVQTDIHLHCKEWDRMLEEENWEPEQIVAKLPTFLQFLRSVQSSVAP